MNNDLGCNGTAPNSVTTRNRFEFFSQQKTLYACDDKIAQQ